MMDRLPIADTAEVVIVGAGAAGLFAALSLAPRRVIVLSAFPLAEGCASALSQGGIAAAVGAPDTVFSHAADTIKAAAGTADIDVAQAITADAPAYVRLLKKYGVRFETDARGNFALSREACHAHRRVLKAQAADGFGRELMRALAQAVRHCPSIVFISGVSAERILRERGDRMGAVAGVLARRATDGKPVIYAAPAVVLATGGIGGLYQDTTNPLSALGRGLAMAARAGAVLSDLEFVQFHPTALDIGESPAPLATEALRGEGAYLVNNFGKRFMQPCHKMGELAPRDVVSRALFAERRQGHKTYLDCRHIDVSHFPALVSACARAGLDPSRDLVPVMPAVHYHMGGIATDLRGRTSIDGLWACGEVAATGLHGANRLASNSLLEAVVMAGRVAKDIAILPPGRLQQLQVPKDLRAPMQFFEMEKERQELRRVLSAYVGVTRNEQGLRRAIHEIDSIARAAQGGDAMLADMALVARMIAVAALLRTESRGAHSRTDYPHADKSWQRRSFLTLKQADAITLPAPVLVRAEENIDVDIMVGLCENDIEDKCIVPLTQTMLEKSA